MQQLKSIALAVCACLFISTSSFGQMKIKDRVAAHKVRLSKLSVKKPLKKEAKIPRGISVRNLKNPVLLSLDQNINKGIRNNPFEILKLELPIKNKSIKLELVKAKIFGPEFKIRQASNPIKRGDYDLGEHYWGHAEGDPNSFVSISVFEEQISGTISIKGKTYNLGKLESSNFHVLHEEDESKPSQMSCHVEDDKHNIGGKVDLKTTKSMAGENCVGIYVETAYDMFQTQGSVAAVINYVTNVFAQVSALYANENINLYVSELWVWDVNDPYTANGPGEYLDAFLAVHNSNNNHNPNYNGDLAHLLSYDVLGGVAYVNVICNNSYGYGFSGISRNYASQPAFSWTVEVITHELGHNLGSPHTHACYWNGDNTPIDGCGPAAGYEEGCNAPLPSNGGTIMSYCHLTNIGIDFNLGFGPQPGNLIRSRVANAYCLSSCSSCETVGVSCNDNNPCTSFDVINENCECEGTYMDSDNDGVCDAEDICANYNDNVDIDADGIPDGCDECITGASCDDGNPCTIGDVNNSNCECIGVLLDSDGDGVCDDNDLCPGSDDSIDADNDGIPDGCDACTTIGNACDDNDPCTSGDIVDENCECRGVLIDVDADGVCANTDPDDNDPCVPNSCDTCPTVNQNNFDAGFGQWSDGGADASISTTNAYSGLYNLRIRDNTNTSIATSPSLDLSNVSELEISFTYIAQSMENGEDFWLQVSTNGGSSFTTVADFNSGIEFRNNIREFVNIKLPGDYSSNTKIRFRCDASNNSDIIYIDDIVIKGCGVSSTDTCNDGEKNGDEKDIDCGGSNCAPCNPTCDDGEKNGDEKGVDCGGANCTPCNTGCNEIAADNFESGWGIWNDGGSDAGRVSQSNYASSGIYSIMLRDNTSSSVVFTDNLDLANYASINVSFNYIARSMDNSSEDFWLEISTNGGSNYSRVEEWNRGDEFNNNVKMSDVVTINGPFSSSTKIRFKCDASANNDYVYLDDIKIEACTVVPSFISDNKNQLEHSAIDIGLNTISSSNNLALEVYPNPILNGDNINIKIKSNQDNVNLYLMDLDGRNRTTLDIDRTDYNNMKLSTEGLSSGTYLIYIQSGTEIKMQKFVVLN